MVMEGRQKSRANSCSSNIGMNTETVNQVNRLALEHAGELVANGGLKGPFVP
jgi:hypothetical protein